MKRVMLLTKENLKALPPLYSQDGLGMQAVAHVKWFTPDAQATWLITEYDPEQRLAFGYADLGQGCGALGYISLDEIESVRGKFGLPVERDRYFRAASLEKAIKSERLTPSPTPNNPILLGQPIAAFASEDPTCAICDNGEEPGHEH